MTQYVLVIFYNAIKLFERRLPTVLPSLTLHNLKEQGIVRCRRYGKIFKKEKGRFIKDINDDCSICLACRTKQLKSIFRK